MKVALHVMSVCVNMLLTSSFRLLTSRTPLDPACPAKATLPAAAAAAAAALRGFRAPDGEQTRQSWNGEQHFTEPQHHDTDSNIQNLIKIR